MFQKQYLRFSIPVKLYATSHEDLPCSNMNENLPYRGKTFKTKLETLWEATHPHEKPATKTPTNLQKKPDLAGGISKNTKDASMKLKSIKKQKILVNFPMRKHQTNLGDFKTKKQQTPNRLIRFISKRRLSTVNVHRLLLGQSNLNGGYEGVREISKRMRFTFGWSTTADAVRWAKKTCLSKDGRF